MSGCPMPTKLRELAEEIQLSSLGMDGVQRQYCQAVAEVLVSLAEQWDRVFGCKQVEATSQQAR
jgi:hypothetical protein